MKVSFVILHYLAEEMTTSCVESLLAVGPNHDVDIIVVDNASGNGSGHRLKDKYSGNTRIHFILLPKNEGFARGNNAGYLFAVENLNPDFIVVLNNDVIIEDKSFIDKIINEYSYSPFAVLGPDIFCPKTGHHQNPAHLLGFSESEILQLRNKLELRLNHYFLKLLCWKIKLLVHLAHKTEMPDTDSNLYMERHDGCVLHGACYIFSRDFIKKRPIAFNPSTFLYFEEDILHYECQKGGIIIRYTPELRVNHFEDEATNLAFKIRLIRDKVKIKRMLDSIDVMLNLIRNDN